MELITETKIKPPTVQQIQAEAVARVLRLDISEDPKMKELMELWFAIGAMWYKLKTDLTSDN